MLDRSPSRAADRQRRHRARLAANRMSLSVELGAAEIDFLVRTRWLADRDVHARDEVGAAIARMLADAARR
jgi:hypothetical protein